MQTTSSGASWPSFRSRKLVNVRYLALGFALTLLSGCTSLPEVPVSYSCPTPPTTLTAPVTVSQPPPAGSTGRSLLEWAGEVVEALAAANARLEALKFWGENLNSEESN